MLTSLSNWLKNNPISAFFALTFLIAWSIWLTCWLSYGQTDFRKPSPILLTLTFAKSI